MPLKQNLADLLEEMSLLMELNGENGFKVRAFQNGARVLEKSDIDLATAIADGSIENLKGIGKGLQEIIREFVATSDVAEYRKLKSSVPPGLLSLTTVRGVGAKKARILYDQLGIASVGELEYACKENRLVELKGFGSKTQESILSSIQTWQASQGKFHQHKALMVAEQIVKQIRDLGSARAEISGGLRRRCEVIEEIIIVAQGSDVLATAASHFESVPESNRLSTSINGISATIYFADAADFESVLFETTGDDQFVQSMSEFRASPTATESALFRQTNLQYVEPELREGSHILSLAKSRSIPTLIESGEMRGMLHIHTTWSDGANSIREMALETKRLGFEYVAICDHSKTAVYANGLTAERLAKQHDEIDALNKEGLGIIILKGIESDILSDGSLDYPDDVLELFDVVVASVHSAFQLPREQQTQRIITAIRNPYTTILGHPTGRLLLARKGYEVNIDSIIDAAAETGTVIELNANPHRFDLDWRWHRKLVERGVKVAIDPDSHQTATLKEVFLGVGIGRKGMLRSEDVINTMTQQEFMSFSKRLRAKKLSL